MGIVDMLKKLEKFFNYRLNPEQIAEYRKKLSGFEPVAERIYDHVTEHELKYPPLALIMAYGFTFQEMETKREHDRIKRDEGEAAKKFFAGDLTNNQFGKAVCGFVVQALNGEITRKEYVYSLKQLGIKTGKIMRFYEDSGLNLDELIGPKPLRHKELI
jgi:hypothetical protein